ncbi:hypothetical protein EKE94_10790 [Mesobaculum littorinae]|uniref:Aminoglycoside phosphotransferase domain-containing protein n=1 Tax=Mesobaculum littorinae TaxID=2486419 RepID=A0A438AGY7_9RHOB|nr:phosphotransferase [Mesobaculum littorinae]RVV97948.1 hypothetical protein EKE94_10790 [Mesobaculum littorinae]
MKRASDEMGRAGDARDDVPGWLSEVVASAGFGGADWRRLSGGRTNQVWRLTWGTSQCAPFATSAICKLYLPDGDTPLFPNDPWAEVAVLRALADTGLSPHLLADLEHAGGRAILTEDAGPVWQGDEAEVMRRLRRLHMMPVPGGLARAPLRHVALTPGQLIAEAEGMLSEVERQSGAGARAARRLRASRPGRPPIPTPDPEPCLLHGDPVAANLVGTAAPVLVDWQCPALGDPVHDLSLVLSPSMRLANDRAPLTTGATRLLLQAYGSEEVATRYLALRPLLGYRLAAYALWKSARGDAGYAPGVAAETALMVQGVATS